MSKKKNLLNLFASDTQYNFHLVKTEEPVGHLIYLVKNGSELNVDTLEFSPTKIAEELIQECGVQIEKFAPAIYFTEESSTEKLKYELNDKLTEDIDFSSFIETIKDEYRVLEVKDSLLFKKDPQAYEDAKRQEYEEHQKELWDEMIKQHKEKAKKREESILAYENDLVKLMKEYFEGIIEYEKRDFRLDSEMEKLVSNLIDPETWIKINYKPFACRIDVCSFEKDKLNVFLTDNNDYSYTATLRFDKTVLVTENVVRINDGDQMPVIMQDWDFISKLYDVDTKNVKDWEFMNDTDLFEYVIDYLAPIFKAEKEKKEKEFVEKMMKESSDDEDNENDDNVDEDEDQNVDEDDYKNYTSTSDWLFDVCVDDEPSSISLVENNFWNKNGHLDDCLGSHNLPKPIIKALNKAGVYGNAELMESIWEVNDFENKTKEDIIKAMENQGFIYKPLFP